MIDFHYINYRRVQYTRLILTCIFLALMVWQIYSETRAIIITCNCVGLVLRLSHQAIELVYCTSIGVRKYLSASKTYLFTFTNLFYFGYFAARMQSLGPVMPSEDDQLLDRRIYFPLANIILIFSTSITLMVDSRCHDEFGKLTQLIFNTIINIRHFLVFYFFWLILFSLLIQISGAEINNKDEYPSMPNIMFYIQSYRNAIGDLDVLDYDFWEQTSFREYNWSMFMIYVIYFIWLSQQFFMFVLLMNFIIAIIQ